MFSNTFKAVVWNVYHGTSTDQLLPHLNREQARGVGLFLMNEAQGKDITKLVQANGLETYLHREYRIAWDPARWVEVFAEHVRLSDTSYQGKKGTTYSEAARVLLCDRQGRSLDVVCYHTPAHIQRRDRTKNQDLRYTAFVESMTELGRLARESKATAFLSGGDDNWDEDTGLQTKDTRPIMLGHDTGLLQLQGGKPTFGRREIDDFRIKRRSKITPTGKVWVVDGGGAERPAHKIHGREFRWRV